MSQSKAWARPFLGRYWGLRRAAGRQPRPVWFLLCSPTPAQWHTLRKAGTMAEWPYPQCVGSSLRKEILAGQWASCLTAGKICFIWEGCKWHEKSSWFPLAAACVRLFTTQVVISNAGGRESHSEAALGVFLVMRFLFSGSHSKPVARTCSIEGALSYVDTRCCQPFILWGKFKTTWFRIFINEPLERWWYHIVNFRQIFNVRNDLRGVLV